MDILSRVKIYLSIIDTSQDALLNQLIDVAKEYATDYCNLLNYNTKLDNAVLQMVVEDYTRCGSDGLIGKAINGLSENYLTDYSQKVIKALNKHRRIKFM